MKNFISLVCFVIAVSACALGYQFPLNFERCHLTDPKLDDCLAKTIENAFKIIGSTGIKSLKIPPIDPIAISKMEIGAGTSAVNLVQRYSDVKTSGLCCQKISKAHFDLDKKVLTFTGTLDIVTQRATYDVDGKILVIPVRGHGDSTISFEKPIMVHTITFKETTKDGKKYFTVENYELHYSIGRMAVEFGNLFDGDKALGDNVNKVINENWEVLFQDVKHGVEASYAAAFKVIASQFFNNIPIDEIFLP